MQAKARAAVSLAKPTPDKQAIFPPACTRPWDSTSSDGPGLIGRSKSPLSVRRRWTRPAGRAGSRLSGLLQLASSSARPLWLTLGSSSTNEKRAGPKSASSSRRLLRPVIISGDYLVKVPAGQQRKRPQAVFQISRYSLCRGLAGRVDVITGPIRPSPQDRPETSFFTGSDPSPCVQHVRLLIKASTNQEPI